MKRDTTQKLKCSVFFSFFSSWAYRAELYTPVDFGMSRDRRAVYYHDTQAEAHKKKKGATSHGNDHLAYIHTWTMVKKRSSSTFFFSFPGFLSPVWKWTPADTNFGALLLFILLWWKRTRSRSWLAFGEEETQTKTTKKNEQLGNFLYDVPHLFFSPSPFHIFPPSFSTWLSWPALAQVRLVISKKSNSSHPKLIFNWQDSS